MLLFFTNWDQFKETIPFGVYFGVVAIVGSMIMPLYKPEGTTIRGFIRRMLLSVILSTGVTWFLRTYMGAGENLCLVVSGLIGFTIDFSTPWLYFKAVNMLKSIFKT